VHGQIDEDIDAILPDQIGRLCVRQPDDAAPGIGERAQSLSHRIGPKNVGVGEDLELGLVVAGQQGQEESAD
jgi:hypothetical protein